MIGSKAYRFRPARKVIRNCQRNVTFVEMPVRQVQMKKEVEFVKKLMNSGKLVSVSKFPEFDNNLDVDTIMDKERENEIQEMIVTNLFSGGANHHQQQQRNGEIPQQPHDSYCCFTLKWAPLVEYCESSKQQSKLGKNSVVLTDEKSVFANNQYWETLENIGSRVA